MKNHYTISDDGMTATIWLKRKTGERLACLVDTADLPKLQTMKTSWYADWNKTIHGFYASGHEHASRKHRMHRFLLDDPQGLEVDHRNHLSLDNRRSNLRVSTRSENGMNRKGAQRNSQTGHRAVSPFRDKFQVSVSINGKRKHCGYFDTIDEAIAVRNQYQGYEVTK